MSRLRRRATMHGSRSIVAAGALAAALVVRAPIVSAQGPGAAPPPGHADDAEAVLKNLEAANKELRKATSEMFKNALSGQLAHPGATPAAGPPATGPGPAAGPYLPEKGVRSIGSASGTTLPGGLYGVEASLPADAEEDRPRPQQAPPQEAPDLHVVKKGDTLWSMCATYFNDPWRWPRLWAQNPLITNPHWIFPGDIVRLRPPGSAAAAVAAGAGAGPGGALPSAEAEEGTGFSLSRQKQFGAAALTLRELGYVESKDLTASAIIRGSREEKILLSATDQVYLSFARDRPLRPGERYTIFMADTKNPITSPETGEILGYMVRIYGDVVVDQITDTNMARGTLVDLMHPVERGHLVSPLIRQFHRVDPRPSAVNLDAHIIASFTPTRMLSVENFVVLSRGRKHGIEPGNRTFAVRRGDGYKRVLEGWEKFDPTFPKEVVGELWVVDVGEATSVAWVVRATKELRIGEMIEMRKGH